MQNLPVTEDNNNYCLGDDIEFSIIKGWEQTHFKKAYDLVLQNLKKYQSQVDTNIEVNGLQGQQVLKTLISALEILEGMSNYQREAHSSSRLKNLEVFKEKFKTFKITSKRTEASNLLIPPSLQVKYKDKLFFSPTDLSQLTQEGVDISDYDPAHSGFWQDTDGEVFERPLEEELIEPQTVISMQFKLGFKETEKTPHFLAYYKGKTWLVRFPFQKSYKIKNRDLLSILKVTFGQSRWVSGGAYLF
jgi:parvulin-like peptidyl-prolyl isomerase